jgi:CMP-N,N'-diacetyllegionaminic acid synthase
MKKIKKYLAIIPARGGSKGIKEKNIVNVGGKPLLHYTATIAVKALKAKIIDCLILSTDSKKIAKIGEKEGLRVPFLRPHYLSTDESKSVDFVKHAVEFFEKRNIFFDAIVILQPTCPLRNYEDIKKCVAIFDKNNVESLITCHLDEMVHPSILYTKQKGSDCGLPVDKDHSRGSRRQEHDSIFIRNGSIYITDINYIKKENKLICDKPLIYEMPKSRSINIDTKEDLILFKKMIREK